MEGIEDDNSDIVMFLNMSGSITPVWHPIDELIADHGRPSSHDVVLLT